MWYNHEASERKPTSHPMNTTLPTRTVSKDDAGEAARYLEERHLDLGLAIDNGWYVSNEAGDGFTRIVIPATTHKTGHVYWQGRAIDKVAYLRYQSPKGPRHEALVVVRPRVARPYGLVIVEGPMDALAAAGEGYTGFALLGMQPSKATLFHLALLMDETANSLVLLDRDSKENALKVTTFLCANGHNARMATLPGPEKDLAACLPSKRRKFLISAFTNLFNSKSSAKPRRKTQSV